MLKKLFVLLLICVITGLSAQPLPHNLTEQERDYLRNNFSDYMRSKAVSRDGLRIPQSINYAPAEYEEAEGVIFAWEGYSSLIKQLVKFVADGGKAFVVVDSSYYSNSAQSTLEDYGVNMDNVEFINAPLNSVWMRDYGPWWIYNTDGEREIIDLVYNRPRPSDDAFPEKLGQLKNITSNKCSLILPGGNLILDGHGTAILTDIVFDPSEGGDPNLTVAQLEKYMKDYFDVNKVILLKHMNEDGTGHVDMFCKLLNDTTVIVGEYASEDHCAQGNLAILNENAELLAGETNGEGEPFNVVRIPMPDASSGYWGFTSYTYTNSLIANKKVLVPVYGFDTDEQALEIYRQNLPGYDVQGFDCSSIISANGAIHCITKLMM